MKDYSIIFELWKRDYLDGLFFKLLRYAEYFIWIIAKFNLKLRKNIDIILIVLTSVSMHLTILCMVLPMKNEYDIHIKMWGYCFFYINYDFF